MANRYSLYGLAIDSELKIPGAPSLIEGAPSVWNVRRGQPEAAALAGRETVFAHVGEDGAAPDFCIDRYAGGVLGWRWNDGVRFWIDLPARRILADWPEGEEESASYYLAGPVLAHVLRNLGATLLHGSAVTRGDLTVAFIGDSGAGKSTLAAAMVMRHGWRAVTDDVIRLEDVDGRWHIHPGYAGHRLWPESAPGVGVERAALPRLAPSSQAWPGWDKRFLDLSTHGDRIAQGPRLLTHVYVLMPCASMPAVEAMRPSSQLMDLDRHAFQHWFRDGVSAKRDLRTLASVVGQCRVRRFTGVDGIDRLPESTGFLMRDIAP
jgi:hypothetical protein